MEQFYFGIPIVGRIELSAGKLRLVIERTEQTVEFRPAVLPESNAAASESTEKGSSPKPTVPPSRFQGNGGTMFDLVLNTAQMRVKEKGENKFTAAELYRAAAPGHPGLKRNSFSAHVIACAKNHGSWKHYQGKRDFFQYLGSGTYSLKIQFVAR